MKETPLLKRIILKLGKISTARAWRNNTGTAWMGKTTVIKTPGHVHVRSGDVLIRNGRPVQFGLPGSGDIIGLRAVEITPELVGATIGQFVSVEVKTDTGRQSEQQKKFGAMVENLGGLYLVARSEEEAEAAIRGGNK